MSIQYNKIQVQVSLENLRHNYRVFRSTCDNVIPVIKSDAYGHGLIEVGQAMEQEGAETLAVGFVNEAVLLRESGCEKGFSPCSAQLMMRISRHCGIMIF